MTQDDGPQWEPVGGNLMRFAVPGGWLYRRVGEEVTTFVPAPPRLVALQQRRTRLAGPPGKEKHVTDHAVIYVRPERVTHIRDAYHEGHTVIVLDGTENGDIAVRGTPAEVAALLGFDVVTPPASEIEAAS